MQLCQQAVHSATKQTTAWTISPLPITTNMQSAVYIHTANRCSLGVPRLPTDVRTVSSTYMTLCCCTCIAINDLWANLYLVDDQTFLVIDFEVP